jgi:carbon-monoxide dehydrogenase large subunit
MNAVSSPENSGIGQPVRRLEDARFLTGRGRFVDDLTLPRQAFGAVLMSPHPHARIMRIDTGAARKASGVLCVLTGLDAEADGIGELPPLYMPEDMGGPKGYPACRPVLCADRVRCVGDRVAFVVAETPGQARDAIELIEIDYEPLPAVLRVEDAVKPGATPIWDACPGNVSFNIAFGDRDACDAAFLRAKHVVKARLVNNRVSANSIEPRCCLGSYDAGDETYTIYTSTQVPHVVRTVLSQSVFNVPETRVRVVSPDVGGGFGMKRTAYSEDALVLWASRRCGCPVKWTGTRSEALLGDTHARDQIVEGEIALDDHGKILAVRARSMQALGAYTCSTMTPTIFSALRFIPSVYDIGVIDVSSQAVFTHTNPVAGYRGAGKPESIYFIERMIDQAAKQLGFDPVDIRRRNLLSPQSLPHTTPTGPVYDSGEFEAVMDGALALADAAGFDARRAQSVQRGRLRGRGLSNYIESAGVVNDRMELRFDPGGTLSIVSGLHSHGQGHATAFTQLASEWLGVQFSDIRFVQGDTDQVPFGRGTYAARSALLGGCALRVAADAIVEKAKPMAAKLLEAAAADIEFAKGAFRVLGTDREISMNEVARAFYKPAGLTGFSVGLEASGWFSAEPPSYPNGCSICEVEIDPDTGLVTLERYAVVDDIGRAINPMICDGQVHGGVAQGVGQALFEQVVFDTGTGQLLSGGFLDYAMPRADDFPDIDTAFHNVPCTTNSMGIKGIGEGGTIGAPPAVIEAVLDALRPLGIYHIDMPATPGSVWNAIENARA